MIKIDRPACPNPGGLAANYRERQCKTALQTASHEKCMYCESKVSHVYFGDVEHIKPKGRFPHLEFEWANLGYVCAKCNNAKRDQWSDETPFIDPYSEDPARHLCAVGPTLHQKHGSERGELTIRAIDLNRAGLVEQRQRRIDLIKALVDRQKRTKSDDLKIALLSEIERELEEDGEYTLVSRTVYECLTAPKRDD